MTPEDKKTGTCSQCGGAIVDGAEIYVRRRGDLRVSVDECWIEYRHAEHGPFPAQFHHDEFHHTPRCNSGGCHD